MKVYGIFDMQRELPYRLSDVFLVCISIVSIVFRGETRLVFLPFG